MKCFACHQEPRRNALVHPPTHPPDRPTNQPTHAPTPAHAQPHAHKHKQTHGHTRTGVRSRTRGHRNAHGSRGIERSTQWQIRDILLCAIVLLPLYLSLGVSAVLRLPCLSCKQLMYRRCKPTQTCCYCALWHKNLLATLQTLQ